MNRLIRTFSASAFFVLAASVSSWADPVLPTAVTPEDVGLSSSQLARIEAVTRQHVDSGLVPGAVMLVMRRGKIAWHRTLGPVIARRGSDAPRLDLPHLLDDQADRLRRDHDAGRGGQVAGQRSRLEYLPEIRKMKVGVEKSGAAADDRLMEPAREMTVQDLLRHTSGLIYGRRGNRWSMRPILSQVGRPDTAMKSWCETVRCRCGSRRAPLGVRRIHRRAGTGRRSRSGKSLGEFLRERILRRLE